MFSVFLILQVGLDPLQLVLMGTILEVSYLLFEIPTGIVADAVSRKWSIVIGFLGSGIAFVLLSFADSFAIAALSQVLYGVFATFISGADVAWLTDEVGEEAARPLYLRSEQFYNGGALVGIVASVALASIALRLPILICGMGYLGLCVALVFLMTESRRPTRGAGTKLRHSMRDTFASAVRQVRAHHVLLLILATAALHGASTEGWDRLSDLQFLQGIGLPPLGDLNPVVWFGVFDGVGLVLGIGALSYVNVAAISRDTSTSPGSSALSTSSSSRASSDSRWSAASGGPSSYSGSSAGSEACGGPSSRRGSIRAWIPPRARRSTRWADRPTPSVRRSRGRS